MNLSNGIIARVQSQARSMYFCEDVLGPVWLIVMGAGQPRTPLWTSSASSAPGLGGARRKSPRDTSLAVFASWPGDCLNFQEFDIFSTKAPAASSSATPIAHIQSTVGWIGKRAEDDEQIKSTEKPENGSKRSSETRLVQIQRPTTQRSQRG